MAVSDFGAPIPGNSLFTHAPGERPWERPTELSTVEDTISFYMTSLSQEDVLDDLMVAIESVIMEFLAAVAESNNIDYKFSNRDPQAELDTKERSRVQMILQGALAKTKQEDSGTELLGEISEFLEKDVGRDEVMEAQDMPAEEPQEMQDVEQTEQAPEDMGLMARR